MKVQLLTFAHAANGLGLEIIPESDIERALLRTLWEHGRMEVGGNHGEAQIRAFDIQTNSGTAAQQGE